MIPTNTDNRGQVGIGTLIIFIALVLVAAVAAGVLVNTSGELQSTAADTGSQAQAEVSNQVDVLSATGVAGANSPVTKVNLTLKKSAGADEIDLEEATIRYTADSASQTLVFGERSDSDGPPNGTAFAVAAVGGTGASPTVLEDTDERVIVTLDTAAIHEGSGLSAGGEATVEIIDQSGASTTYGVNVPSVVDSEYVEV